LPEDGCGIETGDVAAFTRAQALREREGFGAGHRSSNRGRECLAHHRRKLALIRDPDQGRYPDPWLVASKLRTRAASHTHPQGARRRRGIAVSQSVRAFVGLGSNIGDREGHLRFATTSLRDWSGIELIAVSRIYETDPVGPPPQGPYLNACVELSTELPPSALLDALLEIESRDGRERTAGSRWQARTLDLDLLLYGDLRSDDEHLQLPHPRLHERPFVLEPLCDLAADLVHPGLGITIGDLAEAVRDPAGVRLAIDARI
jgi:2-amino-4-hydroxy-6-hydroxymethyldihydropteridine diphosphokinase